MIWKIIRFVRLWGGRCMLPLAFLVAVMIEPKLMFSTPWSDHKLVFRAMWMDPL